MIFFCFLKSICLNKERSIFLDAGTEAVAGCKRDFLNKVRNPLPESCLRARPEANGKNVRPATFEKTLRQQAPID